MSHFGVFGPAATGHLNPMCSVGRELIRRGHRVTCFLVSDAEPMVRAAGLEFVPLGLTTEFPPGELARTYERLGQLKGGAALRLTLDLFRRTTRVILQEGPAALREAGVDAVLIDQISSSGGTVADHLRLPFVTISNALPINEDAAVPPVSTRWPARTSAWSRLRNRAGYALLNRLTRPAEHLVNEYRGRWKLPLIRHRDESFSKLAQISQQVPEFEFPRATLPSHFHFTGPLYDPGARSPTPFPYDRLTGQPLIYASMGTLQNRLLKVFQGIAEACAGLNAQLVISLGGSASPEALSDLPGAPLVVAYAPQCDLLARATLAISHGGLNTVLESLANGVPQVAIPVTNDQPGVAARLAWSGAGEVVPLSPWNVPALRSAVLRVLGTPSYRIRAAQLQQAIQRSGGVSRAAEIIEQAVTTNAPVLATGTPRREEVA